MKLATALALAASLAACDQKSPTVVLTPPLTAAPPEAAPAAAGFVITELKPPQGELPALLAAEAAKAKAKGLKPFIEVSATWCGPCQKLKNSLGDPVMTEAFRGTYIVKLDLDEWETALAKAGYPVKVVPIFFKMGEGGKPTGKSLDGGAWQDDVPAQMAPPLKRFFNS
ncbi:MAG TPA: thioredoxin family protein [Polyangia bacterium]|nr:thioredoxin family protein [Polyangia bacterium]